MIAVSFDDDRATKRFVIALIVALFLVTAVPASMRAIRLPQTLGQPFNNSSMNISTGQLESSSVQLLTSINTSIDSSERSLPALMERSPNKYAAWNLSWDEPIPHIHCKSFGTKEYTARLQNLPFFANRKDACNHTRIIINGILHDRPSSCESKV